MKLDLSEIARNVGMRYHYEIDEPAFEAEGVVCAEPIKGFIDFANTGRAIIAKGQFETTAKLDCSRCLKDFTIPVSSIIEEQFEIPGHPGELPDEVVEPEADLEDEAQPIFVDNILDLTELIRQSIILASPIRPLCQGDCKGLCPACGQNLNEGECGCEKPEDSGAFARLADMWKAKQEEGEE